MNDGPSIEAREAGGRELPASERVWLQVWDLPVRVFHWMLVLSVLTSWFLAGINGLLHETFGYIVLALVLFRLWWGFAGTRHARFRDFVRSPGTVLRYVGDFFVGRGKRYVGHNPAGGAMIIAIILLLLLITATGIMQTTRTFFGDFWVERIHHYAATGLIWLIPLHVLGALFSSVMHRENLIKAMFTGRKPAFTSEEVASAVRGRDEVLMDRVRSSEAFALLALLLAGGVTIGMTTVDKMREREKAAIAAEAKAGSVDAGKSREVAAAEPADNANNQSISTAVPANAVEGVAKDNKSATQLRDVQDYLTGGPESPSDAWMMASGGRIYDRWYAAIGRKPPIGTHPAWPPENTTSKGADTWRCKSCHGWDYLGRDGQYKSGPNATGIRGVQRMRGRPVAEIIAILEDKRHQFSDDIIPGNAKERLAMFISRGQHTVGLHFLPNGRPKGDVVHGREVFQNTCAACHGFDGKARRLGLSADPAYQGEPMYVGTKAQSGPVEVLHKIRNGHPGAVMISLRSLPMQAAVDILAYVQTLPAR